MTSIIKVDNLQNQCGANIISESSNVITIGASGDTVTLAAGASQSGFGRSGSVNWDTTPKTTGFTAVSGNGYFCNTTSAAFTVTLPATPAAGDIVAIADYANTSATNNITVGRNGVNIDGEAKNAVIFVNGQVYTLVYVDATEGWKTVGQTFNQIALPAFVAATGGTVTCCGDYKIHTFTGPGTFTVTSAGNPGGSSTVDYLVVAGGGSGGNNGPGSGNGAGGGAGGFRESKATGAPWTASPLASSTSLPVSVTGYPITVGAGATGNPNHTSGSSSGTAGNPSTFSTITSASGGFGTGNGTATGGSGGSGGGGSTTAGSGNTPPVAPPQGNPGGGGSGAGGGATSAGNATPGPGSGGAGAGTGINPSPSYGTPGPSAPLRYFAGGGGSYFSPSYPNGGTGGGGTGNPSPPQITSGTTNTGSGGGGNGCGTSGTSGAGGSGIVVIRYKFQ